MSIATHIAKQYNDLINGGSIAGASFKEVLKDVSWHEATTKVGNCNTIATLVFHVQYYVKVVTKVLQGGPLEGNDALSFVHPPITSKEDWNALVTATWDESEVFSKLLEELPEEQVLAPFSTYGTHYRNLHGLIEHTHYHLGQISLLKKLIREGL